MKNTPFENHGPCSKCQGVGLIQQYGHYAGGVCFQCGGDGYKLTKRGKAASKFFSESLLIPFSALEIGMSIRPQGSSRFVKVVKLETKESCKWFLDGEWVQQYQTEVANGVFIQADKMVRRGWSKEDKAAKLAAALEFQNSLTKAGTPKKGKA